MPFIGIVMIVFGAVCVWKGVLGLAGREISVPVAGGTVFWQKARTEVRQFSGTEGRIMGGVLLVLGLFIVGAGLHRF